MIKPVIVNTRPVSNTRFTQEVFENAGFEVINFPCIQINTVTEYETVILDLENIQKDDIIIFTSPNAVIHAFKITPKWLIPSSCTVIAVGKKTSKHLEHKISNSIWIPTKQNSEGVIALLKGLNDCKQIVLITAPNGRKVIHEFSKDKNIHLKQINVYHRVIPKVNEIQLEKLREAEKLTMLATSINTLENLKQMLCEELLAKLKNHTLLCASNRIVIHAQKQGFYQAINCHSANPDTMLKYLLK